MAKEENIYLQISKYLQLQYPNLIYHFDFGTGIKMTIGQAVKQKRMNPQRGYPDLFIAYPNRDYSGLFIEIKKVTPYKKNGELKKDKHLDEQSLMLYKLNRNGYCACFAVGFEGVKETIDKYLK